MTAATVSRAATREFRLGLRPGVRRAYEPVRRDVLASTPPGRVAAIWAEDVNGVIGDGAGMLWDVPADRAHFRAVTSGHPVIMGRRTWDTLQGRPLPSRTNVVLTRDASFRSPVAHVVHTVGDALTVAGAAPGGDVIWVIGGADVYGLFVPVADELFVTRVDVDAAADRPADGLVFAPTISSDEWVTDAELSDRGWRPRSGDARWQVTVYRRRTVSDNWNG